MPKGRVEHDVYCIREVNQRKDGSLNVNKYSLMLMRESEDPPQPSLNPLSPPACNPLRSYIPSNQLFTILTLTLLLGHSSSTPLLVATINYKKYKPQQTVTLI